ncbi:EAL domain-containing protein [Neorhizobium sp. BETTINA12A]|uniref:sensor domain-containing protein n=1 Tax=Neorhizobium sp. BETTINA12A TaxID=2908924 RepID=UPI001FF3CA4E|nr:EAL domain-containing protein [Neorhizobium sp. BETTINA12A]MCJ9752799.1 EAL domain-containing protein [Neorhizobium sp. BETTINA12A]
MPSNVLSRLLDSGLGEEIGVLETVFQAAPFPIAIVDHAATLLFANGTFRREWMGDGRQPAALSAILHPGDQDSFHRTIQGLSLDSPAERLELRVPDPNGSQRWVVATFAPLGKNLKGQILSAVHLTDITDQRRQVEELIERESRWDNALVSSVSGVWDHNYATGQKYYSPVWRQIRGMSPEDPLAASTKEWLELVHPDDHDHVIHAIERQNAGDPAYAVFDYRERHKQGHWIWIECRGACVEWDANGKATRVVGTDTDITARKAAEETTAQMSRRLDMALEISGIGVYESDFSTGEVEWDERMFRIYGLAKSEEVKIGGLWESFLHPDDAARVQANVLDNIEEGKRFFDEYRVILRDGSERVIRTRTMSFIDGNGHQKMVGANWDVTADVTLHRELERAKTLAEARNRELEAARSSIEHNAMHDYLTDLPNRRYLDEMLDRMAAECARDRHGIAILHIDLDRFKQINDTLGHSAGDTMLKHVAKVLKSTIRKGDFVARIGGDEFVILSKFEGSPRKLSHLADRIIKELRKPVSYEGHDCRFGASIGIACHTGADVDARQLLLNADIALYRAKSRGRNRHEFFSADTQNEIISTKRISDEILLALERDEFIPYYQLQFDAATLEISGVETLARWMHPERGMLSPDKFLEMAEELDVVSVIDGTILDKALADFRDWRSNGLSIPKLSVNVSYRRLHDASLPRKLKKLKIEPGTVSFELLESIFLDDCDDDILKNLARIKKLGIDIEIDDFGTGHASIISLLRLNPRALKIDRELVRLVSQSQKQRKMVGSIIEIGKSLNIEVVAEGVETTEQIRILRDLGCDVLQGYALARPMPRSSIPDFILSGRWRTGESTQPDGRKRHATDN